MTNAHLLKLGSLQYGFRQKVIQFCDELEAHLIPYIIGETYRDKALQLTKWKVGRRLKEGLDPALKRSWTEDGTATVITRAFPGESAHEYGLALEIYPKDEHGQIMADTHPRFEAVTMEMWVLAEQCGIDALGHRNLADPNDQFWGNDPSHYQEKNWMALVKESRQV